MRKFATVSGADKTFGLRDKDGRFYIGNKEAKIKENNIIVGDKVYTGTPGLWELIVARSPDEKLFTNGDYDNYAEIMHSTNALRRNNDESDNKPKAKRSWKWKHILVVGFDQRWLKNEVICVNIIMVLILFYGNVLHYYIHDVIIIKLTYDISNIAELVSLNENERKDLSV